MYWISKFDRAGGIWHSKNREIRHTNRTHQSNRCTHVRLGTKLPAPYRSHRRRHDTRSYQGLCKPQTLLVQAHELLVAADNDVVQQRYAQHLTGGNQTVVIRTSSGLGVGSPEGWVCTTIIDGAFSRMAGRNISTGRTTELLTLPTQIS
jgi:hypothetical protein